MRSIIILLALLGTALAVPKNVQKIVGGSGTTIAQYPFMSNMQHHDWGLFWSHACGGTLITSSSILSASSCYFGSTPSDWRVRLGTTYASSGGSVHDVSEIRLHPGYNVNTYVHDVAIIKLTSPALSSATIQPARIAGVTYILPDNTYVVSLGWGALSYIGHYPEQLQEVQVQTINHEICKRRYEYLKSRQPGFFESYPAVTDDMLCSGILDVGGRGHCDGDSGGPLIHNNDIIVGVISWGHRCAEAAYPGVNARVSYHSDWIVANGAA